MVVCFESTRSEGGMKFLLRCVAVVVEKDDVDDIDNSCCSFPAQVVRPLYFSTS